MSAALEDAADATIRRMHFLQLAAAEQVRRHRDWQDLHESGMSAPKIEAAMQTVLAERGLDESDIAAAGVSHYSIALALRSYR